MERAELARESEQARMLCMECDFLRDLIKAKDEYTGCYKTGRRPTEKLFKTLDRLNALLLPNDSE